MIEFVGYIVREQQADDPLSDYTELMSPRQVHDSFGVVRVIVSLEALEEGLFELKIVRDLHLLEIKPEYRKA